MSYQEQSTLYRDPGIRGRLEACIHEQGAIFVNDGRADIAALGSAVVAGKREDIESLIWASVTGPNWNTLSEDAAMLAAVQGVWPTVAAALYPTSA